MHYPTRNKQHLVELKQKNLELILKLARYESLYQENQNLKKALNFKTNTQYHLIGAEVLAFSPSAWQRLIVVNVGEDQGVTKGLFAIDQDGNLLGRIVEADKKFAYLMLVGDPDFTASVFIGQGALGLLKGGVTGAQVLYVEDSDNIKLGDKVWLKVAQLSSAIEIGKVKSLSKTDDSLFWNVGVEMFQEDVTFNQIYIVK
ncbi:MAG: rod shape-determining protein MreC [Candidatus Omnitrophica bacterium]|nr:rod shape-determining protein MreC [Candidatus Omnitrophota bacterium]